MRSYDVNSYRVSVLQEENCFGDGCDGGCATEWMWVLMCISPQLNK